MNTELLPSTESLDEAVATLALEPWPDWKAFSTPPCLGPSNAFYRNAFYRLIVAHARLIDKHEAFKQEVNNAVGGFARYCTTTNTPFPAELSRFIIPKPDPLVAAIKSWGNHLDGEAGAEHIRAALAARGLKIVEATDD